MTGPGRDEPPTSGDHPDELDLDKETIRDLDSTDSEAEGVIGGVGVGVSDAGICPPPRTGTKPPTTT